MGCAELMLALLLTACGADGCPKELVGATTGVSGGVCRHCKHRYPYSYQQSASAGFDYRRYFDYPWSQRPTVPSALFSPSVRPCCPSLPDGSQAAAVAPTDEWLTVPYPASRSTLPAQQP